MDSEGNHLKAAVIAAKLRDAGLDCEIINLVSVPTSVLRRDRIVVILALALLTVLTWSYVLWLSVGMSMGGMDMTGLRMIPSGTGLMIPADMPWRALEFAFVFAMWTVMMVGMMTPSAAPMMPPVSADKLNRRTSHSLQLFGSLSAISLYGSLLRYPPLLCSGPSNALLRSISGWQPRATCWEGSCS